jgi:hypothetical protein
MDHLMEPISRDLKIRVLAALRARMAEEQTAAVAAQREVHAGATHEESRAENDKDTRALEASYLARGLAGRVAELEEAALRLGALELRELGADDPIVLTALIEVEDDEGQSLRYFMAPAGGGVKLSIGDARVQVVTPTSPLGRSLLGKRAGDQVELRTPRGTRLLKLAGIC